MNLKEFLDNLYMDATYSDTHGRNSGFSMSRNEVNSMFADYYSQLDQRNWQEQMYNKYESPAAMVRQYEEAGLNPALMYGQGSSPSSSMSSSGSAMDMPDASGSRGDSPMAIMSTILSALGGITNLGSSVANTISDVKLRSANADLAESQANYYDTESRYVALRSEEQEIINKYADVRESLRNDKSRADINESFTRMIKNLSDVTVNNSTIEVNGTVVDLNRQYLDESESREALNITKNALAKLDVQKAEKLLPFVQQREVQELNLMYSQEKLNDEERELRMWQANWELLQSMKEMDLVDAGFYNDMAELNKTMANEEIKTEQTQRKIAVADCVVGNTVDVVNCAVGAATGLGGLQVDRSRATFENYRDMQSGTYMRDRTTPGNRTRVSGGRSFYSPF